MKIFTRQIHAHIMMYGVSLLSFVTITSGQKQLNIIISWLLIQV